MRWQCWERCPPPKFLTWDRITIHNKNARTILRKMVHQVKKLFRGETTIPQPVQLLPKENKIECKLCKSQHTPAMQGFPCLHPLLWQPRIIMFQKQQLEKWTAGPYCSSMQDKKKWTHLKGQNICLRSQEKTLRC